MEKIRKEQLAGYRKPTEDETKKIKSYLVKDLKKESVRYRRTSAFLGTITGIFTLSVLYRIAGDGGLSGEALMMTAVTLAVFGGCVGAGKIVKRNKFLTGCVETGNFEVMDCVSELFETDVDQSGKGTVLIRDGYGRLCGDYFLIDFETAKKYRGNTSRDLLLMKQKECDYYRIFTEAMLNTR